jgi:hypothetical protein
VIAPALDDDVARAAAASAAWVRAISARATSSRCADCWAMRWSSMMWLRCSA